MAEPSPKTFNIGGLAVHVFGTERLDAVLANGKTPEVAVCFFAHGRMGRAEKIFHICQAIVSHPPSTPTSVVLVAAFDQRNHGSRLTEKRANLAWTDGNELHAYDMFAIHLTLNEHIIVRYGTAQDISYLADVLPMYLNVSISRWAVAGISLGGHTALLTMANDPRFTVCVCIIGCGDYTTLMRHRASSSPSISIYTTTLSTHLLSLLSRVDPINNLSSFKGKALLFLGGAEDKLVPPSCNDSFFEGLRTVYKGEEEKFEVIMEGGVGHEVTAGMEGRCVEWVNRWIFKL
ncbi:hypothetical protein HK097_008829 [Rhizophlyctis rosea]|uniref:Peptidase S9 prolyl oligopeptidase catalytic domain-containing protein n=1 Tax=Rhizophlyctis rosea TaxID=64517 RepID=A0AAD5X1G3_9FUNG|nr:hypothetical protein HK097_008829 [Rhizophlyctis rosea]